MCAILVAEKKTQVFAIAILVHHILGIPTNQIETEWIFSIVGILMALCKCHLQIGNLDKLIFINKKWPSYPWISCVKPTNLASRLWKWNQT
jgi:hypothetical protein